MAELSPELTERYPDLDVRVACISATPICRRTGGRCTDMLIGAYVIKLKDTGPIVTRVPEVPGATGCSGFRSNT
jgi:hypothetical protein